MNAAAFLLLYAAALTWGAHLPLRRLSTNPVHPGLAATAWSTAIIGALGAWAAALIIATIATARTVLYGSPLTFCLTSLGMAQDLDLPRHVAPIALVTLLSVSSVLTALIARRIHGLTTRMCRSSHAHAAAARIIGRQGNSPDLVIITERRPAAYCVAGQPPTVVVTTGALQSLGEAELAAVLAHERAHLRGRHHHILMVLRALSVALSRLPLFAAAPSAVATLLEMCADDTAVRRHGGDSLLGGLIALAGQPTTAAAALAAADLDVLARAKRLTSPAPWTQRCYKRTNLVAVMSLIAATPVLTAMLCHH